MTRRLTRIEAMVQRQTPDYVSSSVVPRGTAIPIDKFMVGISRFCRKIGSSFPILTPALTTSVNNEVSQGERSIETKNTVQGLAAGCIISIAERELQFVQSTDSTRVVISGDIGILSPYPVDTKVYLHAVPVTLTADVTAGSNILEISSDHLLVLGDKILELLTNGVPGSSHEHVVGELQVVQEDVKPYTYVVTLDGLTRRGWSADDVLYLRAFPAYKSRLIPLPTQPTALGGNVGPFLWDYVDGRMHDGIEDPTVVVALSTFSAARTILQDFTVTGKNTVNSSVVIPSHMFALWDLNLGELEYSGSNSVGILDPEGDFMVVTELIPAFPGSNSWQTSFSSDTPMTVTVGFRCPEGLGTPSIPGPEYVWKPEFRTLYYSTTLIGGGTVKTVQIQTPDMAYDSVSIGAFGEAGASLTMRSWNSSTGHCTWVQYTMVAYVGRDYAWAGSGLFVKPVFWSRDSLQQTDRLDSGQAEF